MADQMFDGRVALITRAGRGIGREHALLMARHGASIVVNDLGGGVVPGSGGSSCPAEALVTEILAAVGRAVADTSDISIPGGAGAAVRAALDAFGGIHCIINNAGTSVHNAFMDVTPDMLERMLRLHIGGHFWVTQAAWPHLVAQKYRRLVFTTSSAGLFGSALNHDYAAAKGGIAGLTRSLAPDAAEHGITVNAVAPLAATRLADNIEDAALREAFKKKVRPDQIAPLVALLVSEACTVTGQIFEVGGGLVARAMSASGKGYLNSDHGIADTSANLDPILCEEDYTLPTCGEESAGKLLNRLGVAF